MLEYLWMFFQGIVTVYLISAVIIFLLALVIDLLVPGEFKLANGCKITLFGSLVMLAVISLLWPFFINSFIKGVVAK